MSSARRMRQRPDADDVDARRDEARGCAQRDAAGDLEERPAVLRRPHARADATLTSASVKLSSMMMSAPAASA